MRRHQRITATLQDGKMQKVLDEGTRDVVLGINNLALLKYCIRASHHWQCRITLTGTLKLGMRELVAKNAACCTILINVTVHYS